MILYINTSDRQKIIIGLKKEAKFIAKKEFDALQKQAEKLLPEIDKLLEKNKIKLKELIIWSVFWLIAGVVVIVPNSTNTIAGVVGIGRGADLVVYISLALLFYILFRIFYRLEKIEKNITKLHCFIQHISIYCNK